VVGSYAESVGMPVLATTKTTTITTTEVNM
jgi:hypothetical protein